MNKRPLVASTRVTTETFAALERLAEQEDTTVAHIVRKAITAYLRANAVAASEKGGE